MYEKRKDPFTGEEFYPKRNNQKFANRKNQIAFNNKKARLLRETQFPVNTALKQNLNILKVILAGRNSIEVSKTYLLGAGFNFQFYNRTLKKDGVKYQCIYNYAICLLENGNYKIIKMS